MNDAPDWRYNRTNEDTVKDDFSEDVFENIVLILSGCAARTLEEGVQSGSVVECHCFDVQHFVYPISVIYG